MKKNFPPRVILKTLILSVSFLLFSQSYILLATPLSSDKWKPGHYVKIEDWQLTQACNPTGPKCQMEKIYDELKATPALRGVKIMLMWSRYETRTNSVSTFDFSSLNTIINNIKNVSKSGNDKHVILGLTLRINHSASEDTPEKKRDAAKLMLPNDLQGDNGLYTAGGTPLEHYALRNAYAFMEGSESKVKGYNLKIYLNTLRTRLDAFIQALADEYDDDNVLVQVSTTESAMGIPVVPFGSGVEPPPGTPDNTNYYGCSPRPCSDPNPRLDAGMTAIINSLNTSFVKTPVVPSLNFSREYVRDWAYGGTSSNLVAGKFGLGSPNSFKDYGVNRPTGTGTPPSAPGVLTYYPGFHNIILLAPEVQGADYKSDNDPNNPVSNPSYESIYLRVKNDLDANYVVWQRNFPYWLGDSSAVPAIPSVLNFLKTYSLITSDTSGSGGLNATQPTYLK